MSDYLVVSEEELKDADEMLSGIPDIEVCPPVITYKGHRGKLIEQENPPWVKLSVAFRDNWMKELKGSKLPVFLAIALHINTDGQSFPDIDTIAGETGYSEREVTRAVRELEEMGLLEVRRVFKDKIHRKNYYTVKAMISYGYSDPISDLKSPSKSKVTFDAQEGDFSTETTRQKSVKVDSLSRLIKRDSKSQQKLHPVPSSPAIKESQTMTTIEQHKKRTEEALFASMTNDTTGYAHYPEQVRQVVLRVATLWNLRAPERPRGGRGKQYAYWIESCRALQDACGEFGVEMLDKLRDDFVAYMAEHGGVAPHTVSSPNSLVNSAAAKAALLRGGNTAPMWGSRLTGKPQARQTTLDV